MFGFVSVFDGLGSPHTYVAHADSEATYIPRNPLMRALETRNDLWLAVVRQMSSNHRTALQAIEDTLFTSTRRRLAIALVNTSERHGLLQAGGGIEVSLTQDELANLLGVTRQSISKELKRFERDGLLQIHYRRMLLLDLQRLRAV